MEYPKKIMRKKELEKLGFPERLLLRAAMERGQTFAFRQDPGKKTSPWLFDTEGFAKWIAKQAKATQREDWGA